MTALADYLGRWGNLALAVLLGLAGAVGLAVAAVRTSDPERAHR